MLMHKNEQKRKIKRLLSFTFTVTVLTALFGGYSLYSWVNDVGAGHRDSMYSVVLYSTVSAAEYELTIPEKYEKVSVEDPRDTEKFKKKVTAVRKFFNSYNAPLAANAEDFVRAADMYGIDYRLMPAISINESSGGKFLFRQYNPFGWGRSGYPSFTAAIYDVARGLSLYYKSGLRQPEQIAYRYNPATPKEWGASVRYLINKMPAL